jgi:hypothetical protein
MNDKNKIFIVLGFALLLAATGLAVWYAYLTKQSVTKQEAKSFSPLVVPSQPGGDSTFNNNDGTGTLEKNIQASGDAGKTTSPDKKSEQTPTKPATEQEKGTEKDGVKKEHTTLTRLYEGPVAGYVFFAKDATTQVVRMVERQRGNIVDVPLYKKTPERVSNSTILGVQRAFFTPDAQHVFIQHLDEDDSLLTLSTPIAELMQKDSGAKDDSSQTAQEIGTYLPVNIGNLLVHSDSIVFMTQLEDGTSQIVTTDLDGGKTKRLWKNPLSGWNISWGQQDSLLIQQKPSTGIPGYGYILDTKTGASEKIIGDRPGLQLLQDKTGKRYLGVETEDDGTTISFIYNTETRKRTPLKDHVLPEKCAWATGYILCGVPKGLPQGTYPDEWYRGSQTYVDTITKIYPDTGNSDTVVDTTVGESDGLDVTQPLLTEDARYFFFIDKTTGTLWEVDTQDK